MPSNSLTAEAEARIGALTSLSAASGSNTLYWSTDLSNYVPETLRTNTSRPRTFIGPADPSLITGITMADYDTWRRAV